MKKMILSIISLSILLVLTACGNEVGTEQISLEEFEEILEEGKDVNILVYFDNDSNYLKDVETVIEEQELAVKIYNPNESDGESNNGTGQVIYPENMELEYNTLYQIKEGQIINELQLDYFLGAERREEVKKTLVSNTDKEKEKTKE